ncbi:MAG: NAD(P)H-hydrate dehydratase [Alphaproteobacteria bacterium]|nr:NAD(P)H-hydrate dehydratase [Alphaproteobacteria bacterium]
MSHEIVTVAEMYAADRYAADHGTPSLTLMENAGRTVVEEIARIWRPRRTLVLCGPGNNGGDGFVVARLLTARGWDVRVALLGRRENLKGDAVRMAAQWTGRIEPLSPSLLDEAELVVDALFGAGLQRPLEGIARDTVLALNISKVPVVAVDMPSGVHGDFGRALDDVCVKADVTVTFFRRKPAHVLMPGRLKCGRIIVTQIGIPDAALEVINPKIFANEPALWGSDFPRPDPLGHKYARGHALIVSGPAQATGAARLAARGALRIGAGLVSVASPLDAVAINAAQLAAIMVKPFNGANGLAGILQDKRFNAVVIGPGCGVGQGTRELVTAVLKSGATTVLDADALTSFAHDTQALFHLLRPSTVLTPHEGEFERLFPGLLAHSQSRIDAVRDAASAAKCIVLLKGPDTAIAGPDGRVCISTNAPPTLATAGSGDVLAGFIAGLLAQGMDTFQAAAAAAWLHGEAAAHFGPGLISEDLPEQLPARLRQLYEDR